MSLDNLWVFGYGSLCWNPGFEYSDSTLGYVKGFKRRFWQGNNSHRGTEKKLGRVVTLIQDENEVVWGKAFKLNDEKASRTYLDTREVQLGGYTTILTTFEPLDENIEPFPVLIYIALEGNDQYLGKASYNEMAMDIISSKGSAGHNLEYLAKLAQFMREHLPEIEDNHLYLLEQFCIFILKSLNSSLISYFYIQSVEQKWLKQIHFELSMQHYPIRKAHNLEVSNSFDSSDSEESDASETNPCFCCDKEISDSEFSDSELLNNDLSINKLLNGSLLNDDLLNDECLYLNDELLISQRSNKKQLTEGLNNNDKFLQKKNHSIRRTRNNSFSEFNHQKLYIKGY